jgi:hypothetical protein
MTNNVAEMEDDGLGVVDSLSKANHLRDDHDTVIRHCEERLPSPIETALIQYADSMESLSASTTSQGDLYTRGFVAGLRAAIKVAANIMNS